jgi:Leucine-rich repeat (LRR) protein
LGLKNNQLTSFDGTDLTSLTQLNLIDNQLTSFDGTDLTSLTELVLGSNQLTSFDGTDLSSLTDLNLGGNQLTSFDGTDLSSLTSLGLDYNQLTSFDGTGLSSLTTLFLENNQLTSFDGTDLSSLTQLYLTSNQLTSFDGTGLTSLTFLELQNNQLTSFDGTDLTSLTYLYLRNNQLTSFDGTGLSSLTELILFGNLLTSLDVSPMVSLESLYLADSYGTLTNPMTPESNDSILSQLNTNGVEGDNGGFYTINGRTSAGTADYDALVAKGWNLLGLDLASNPTFITSKSVGQNIFISVQTSTGYWKYNHNGSDSSVFSNGNQTTTVSNVNGEFTIIPCLSDGTVSGDITYLDLNNNQLTSFDGTDLTSLTQLNLYDNLLTSFDGTGLSSLTWLELGGNQLTSFDGTGLTSLTYLGLENNTLTSLSGFVFPTSLTNLQLQNNQLTSFDGTGLSSLTSLILFGNLLTSLDVSPMTSLANLYLADSYGTLTNPMTAVSNNSILSQLNANDAENSPDFFNTGNFVTINGRTSAGTADYDALIAKGWNLLGLDLVTPPPSGNGKLRIKGVNSGGGTTTSEEEISFLFDLTVDNGIPNQLVVLSTLSSGGPADGPGGRGPGGPAAVPGGKAKGPGGPAYELGDEGGGITEYASIVTDENGIAVFSGITGSTTMWAVQVYNTPVKEGIVVWASAFEANNSTTSVTQTRTFYDVNFLNQDDNGVISNSSVDIYLVDGDSDGDIYPIFMFSGTTDVNGNITTNLSNGSYIIRTFDENGDLTWGQYFDVAEDVVSISRPLSEDVEINISGLITTTYTNMWTVNNNVPVEGMDVYYYDGSKEVYSFDPLSPIGESTIVNPTLTLLGQTDSTGGFTTNGTPVSISSGVIGVTFGNTDVDGREYVVISNEYNTIELGTNINGTKVVDYIDINTTIQYSEWHPQAPTGKHIRISVVQNANWVAIDSFNSVEGVNTYFSRLAGGTEYKLDMYNDLTVMADGSNIGYTEYWTPNWNDSKTTIWDGVPN